MYIRAIKSHINMVIQQNLESNMFMLHYLLLNQTTLSNIFCHIILVILEKVTTLGNVFLSHYLGNVSVVS